VTQKNRVFANALVGGYGTEKRIERQSSVLVTYRRSQENLKNLRMFRFSDGIFRSYNDAVTISNVSYYQTSYLYNGEKPCVFTSEKTKGMSNILVALGFEMSEVNLDEYEYIKQCLTLPKDLQIFPDFGGFNISRSANLLKLR